MYVCMLYNDANATCPMTTDTLMMLWETCFQKFCSTWRTILKTFKASKKL